VYRHHERIGNVSNTDNRGRYFGESTLAVVVAMAVVQLAHTTALKQVAACVVKVERYVRIPGHASSFRGDKRSEDTWS
jgi:hypothetical protein